MINGWYLKICDTGGVKVEDLITPSGFKCYEFMVPSLNSGARMLLKVNGYFGLPILIRFSHPENQSSAQ